MHLSKDTTLCSGRVPDPNARAFPMRHWCARWLDFKAMSDEGDHFRNRSVTMPPKTAYSQGGERPPLWECKLFVDIRDESD